MPPGRAPWGCTQQLPFFLNGEVKPQNGSPKNIVGRFMQSLDIYLIIYFSLNYFIIA
jgi:hypothetical protein